MRSDIHVLEMTSKETAKSCAPCLSSNVGTYSNSKSGNLNKKDAIL